MSADAESTARGREDGQREWGGEGLIEDSEAVDARTRVGIQCNPVLMNRCLIGGIDSLMEMASFAIIDWIILAIITMIIIV